MRSITLLFTFVLTLIIILPASQPAFACTTPYQPVSMETNIEEADYIVKATVIAVDDASQNAILRAEQYLTGGSGPQYLLFYRANPVLSSVYYGHHYDTGCLYGGTNPIPLHSSGYYALRRLPTGAYTFVHYRQSFESTIFSPPNDSIELRIDPTGDDSPDNIEEMEDIDEADFLDLVAELSGEQPAFPSRSDYPRLKPLLITTTSGAQYLYPVDGGPLVDYEGGTPQAQWSPIAYPDLLNLPPFCAEVGCELSIPDQSLFAVQMDKNTIQVDYPFRWDTNDESTLFPITIAGQAFAFSPTSEAFLVWTEDMLSVNLIYSTWCQCSYGELVPTLDTLTEIPLAVSDGVNAASLHGQAVWSADGTTLAYADAQGVWLLDLFRSSQPQLIIETTETGPPTPLYLSTTGRFLAYTVDRTASSWVTLDRVTGYQHENAIVSPNERHLAQINPTVVEPDPDTTGCRLPIMETCRVVLEDQTHFEWRDGDTYVRATCSEDENDQCRVTGRQMVNALPGSPVIRSNPDFRAYRGLLAYDPEQDLFACVTRPQTIRVDGVYDRIHLRSQLDSDIVAIDWLPSLFYSR